MAGAVLPNRELAAIADQRFEEMVIAKKQLKESQEQVKILLAQRATLEAQLARVYDQLDAKDLEIADLCGKLLAARSAVGFLQPEAEAKP